MKIIYHRKFKKNFKKLPKEIRKKAGESIALFAKNPFDSSLKNHALKGKMNQDRAFSVTDDYRVIYRQKNDYILVIMLKIGTHNQIY